MHAQKAGVVVSEYAWQGDFASQAHATYLTSYMHTSDYAASFVIISDVFDAEF